jgi:hypothetical protein
MNCSPLVLLGTTSASLTGAPLTFDPDAGVADGNVQNTPQSWRVRVWADQDFHVSTSGDDATASDCPVAAGYEGITVVVSPGGNLSVISAGTNGNVWFTRIKHAG